MKRAVALLALLAGCASFEDKSIVLDLRVLAMQTLVLDGQCDRAFPHNSQCFADQVIDVDLTAPDLEDVLLQLQDTYVRALVSDPSANRSLDYQFTLCLPDDDDRCDLSLPHFVFEPGRIADPDTSSFAQYPEVTVDMDLAAQGQIVLAMLIEAVRTNPIDALGGVDLFLELRIGGADEDPAARVVAVKRLRIAPRIPSTRLPNRNPTIERLDGAVGSLPFDVGQDVAGNGLSRCQRYVPGTSGEALSQGDVITLFPVEGEGVRETYDSPGLDGSAIQVEETISYQWLATGGGWSDDVTGGGRDILGNQSLLGSDWTAPARRGLYPIWMIQRDERLGVTWLETCLEVL